MPERWRREVRRWGDVRAPGRSRARLDDGPRGDGMPPSPGRGQRVAAGLIAFAVFGGALALAAEAFDRGDEPIVSLDTVSPAPSSSAPASEALVVTLDALDDGFLPQMTLTYRSHRDTFYGGGRWDGEPIYTVGSLLSFEPRLDLGAPLVIEGDATEVEVDAGRHVLRRSARPHAHGARRLVGEHSSARDRRFLQSRRQGSMARRAHRVFGRHHDRPSEGRGPAPAPERGGRGGARRGGPGRG